MCRSIGVALEGDAGASFRGDHPEAHASFAYAMAFDWKDVRRTVREVPNHRTEPPLLERLAEAEWRLHRRQQAVSVWFELCWLDPERFADAERASRVSDSALRQSWQRLQDQDWFGPVTTQWLPAWMVLEEPGIAQAFAPTGRGSDPERAFDLLLRLTSGRSGAEDIGPTRIAGPPRRALPELLRITRGPTVVATQLPVRVRLPVPPLRTGTRHGSTFTMTKSMPRLSSTTMTPPPRMRPLSKLRHPVVARDKRVAN